MINANSMFITPSLNSSEDQNRIAMEAELQAEIGTEFNELVIDVEDYDGDQYRVGGSPANIANWVSKTFEGQQIHWKLFEIIPIDVVRFPFGKQTILIENGGQQGNHIVDGGLRSFGRDDLAPTIAKAFYNRTGGIMPVPTSNFMERVFSKLMTGRAVVGFRYGIYTLQGW